MSELDMDEYGSLPPPRLEPHEQCSLNLAQVDTLRRVLAWLIYRYKLPNNIGLGKFELDHAPVETLIVSRDKHGNASITIDAKNMGS